MKQKILVIDDDVNILKSLEKVLKLEGFHVETLSSPQQVAAKIKEQNFHCILLDIKMPGMDGLEVLSIILKQTMTTPVIMISGQSDIDIAVRSIKKGAYDFIEKPIDPERLLITVNNAIQKLQLIARNKVISHELEKSFKMIGRSPAIYKIYDNISRIAATPAKALILGESGTGKELVARALHFQSDRATKPYLKINCAAIPDELLESQLFGHKKGSFTGASMDHRGVFLQADEGTLFLDEIGDMNLALQAKLLRVLQENEVDVIGNHNPIKIDVRIISASNKNLWKMVKEGLFREDLFHRLNVVEIYLPPLRERLEDILPLAYHFLKQFSEEYNRPVVKLHQQAEAYLLNYSWPGNVRELKNLMERLVLFVDGDIIKLTNVMQAFQSDAKPAVASALSDENTDLPDLKTALYKFEKQYIIQSLNHNHWKKEATARTLGIDRSSLFRKQVKFNIDNSKSP